MQRMKGGNQNEHLTYEQHEEGISFEIRVKTLVIFIDVYHLLIFTLSSSLNIKSKISCN